MVNLMRKYQQGLLMVVTFFIIICFAWLYNDYGQARGGADGVAAVIYDKPVKYNQFERAMRRFDVARDMGVIELLMALAGDARSQEEAKRNFALNTYVLRHEADAMGVEPTDAEILEQIKALPFFQTNGVYDHARYTSYVQFLPSRGFNEKEIEDIVKDRLRVEKLRELVTGNLSAAPSEVRRAFEEANQKVELSYVRIKEEDVAKEVTISDEDLKKAFEERKDTFKSDEMRKVKFVSFVIPEEKKKLAGKERAAELQKLVDKAQEFSIAMTASEAKLEEVAQKFGVTVAETPEFPRREAPAELGETDAAATTAFEKLTLEKPNSDPIPSEKRDGYFILQLSGITPSRPQTFEEVKTRLADTLKRDRVNELLTTRTTELRAKLDAELKAGKSFADAAKGVGLTPETMEPFSQAAPPKVEGNPDAMMIARASMESKEGQLSEPIPSRSGRILFRVEKRQPIDEAAFEKEKPNLIERLAGAHAEQVFHMWIQERAKAANLRTAAGA
jgi:peptidyl-prolyl cis-trans isomerase D